MSLPACKPRVLAPLCFCLLALVCVGVCQDEGPSGTPGSLTPRLEGSRWSQMQNKMKEMVTRTRDKWQHFWSPEGFRGFLQTYYDDHLRGLGTRTKTWLHNSKEAVLDKAHSLCPKIICKDKDRD
ncbi:PREDICTED: apolipoprotein C-IV [Chrysochloris asiatica]|uniref:Apolipoprotein C-IV n=1 Tax=Chrysochloris asiatica TaxID=185453 RepID=A0A9B0TW98_CHRAS|nr:PREDICTED: apolipoprotein C-IV [Chrysochloris asiatica]